LYLFIGNFLLEILAIANHWDTMAMVTKPLLIALLITWFISVSNQQSSLRYWVVAALFFSWVGDVFLMIPETANLYFMAGLASFLLAHILYIIFFIRIRSNRLPTPPWRIGIIVLIAAYTISLYIFLLPHLGNLTIPVAFYAITISVMLLMAIHALPLDKQSSSYGFIIGAILFVASDSLLAMNKFNQPFAVADISIMATYGIAQFALVYAASIYLGGLPRTKRPGTE